jgi:hypothetical protein
MAGAKPPLPWQVEMVRTGSLKPPHRQARTHPKAQIAAIANSIQKFGAMCPIIADEKEAVACNESGPSALSNQHVS